MCLAQGHNAVTPVRHEPATPLSRDKHSTTEPLRSQGQGPIPWVDNGVRLKSQLFYNMVMLHIKSKRMFRTTCKQKVDTLGGVRGQNYNFI